MNSVPDSAQVAREVTDKCASAREVGWRVWRTNQTITENGTMAINGIDIRYSSH